MYLLGVIGKSKYVEQRRKPGEGKVNIRWSNFGNELGFAIGLQVVFGCFVYVAPPWLSKGGSHVSHPIKLHAGVLAFKDRVVFIFKVPIIQKRHHDPESIKFAGAIKRIMPPTPLIRFLFMSGMALQADALDMARSNHK